MTGRLPLLTKTRIKTSIDNAFNDDSEATIGEFVTYELAATIPEGQIAAAEIIDSLDPGLAFVEVISVAASPVLTIDNPIGIGTSPSHVSVTDGGATVTFGFGDIVNPNTNNAVAETVTIRYRAVVLNVAGNQSSPTTHLDNSAVFRWTGHSLAPVAAPAIQVIEPQLQLTKSANPSQVDAQDTVAFSVTVSHVAAGSTDAHDLSLVDVLPAGFSYVAGSLTHQSGIAPSFFDQSGGTITATWPMLSPGQSSTLRFEANVDPFVQAGNMLTNTANVSWTSLLGSTGSDLSIYNAASRERTGAGGINDYTASDAATVNVNIATAKSIAATSELNTSGGNVAVGEIVRYHLWAQLPEGTAPAFQMIDSLPEGMQFLDDGTSRFAFVSNDGGIQSSTLGTTGAQTGNSGSVTPTSILPAPAISGGPFVSGTDPVFFFGDLTNSDNDADAEFVVLEFNALVLNVASNVQGATHHNSSRAFVGGSQVGPDSNVVQTTVAEPSITDTNKTVLSPATGTTDAGETVTYSVTYSNSSAPGTATAFDVHLTDGLPAGMNDLDNVLVFRNGSQILAGFTDSSSTFALDVTVAALAPGDQIEIRYDAMVAVSNPPGATINNTVLLQYTSLPGVSGTTPNPTGSVAGASGAITGERNGTGGVNNYNDADSAGVSLLTHAFSGFVYYDQNNNGLFDDGAGNGLPGVTVLLTGNDHLGANVSRSTTTDGTGGYRFDGLRPGIYSLAEVQPAGYLSGLDSLGSPELGATNANRYDDLLASFTIAVGTPSTDSSDHNFGELLPAVIAGFVYVDADNNGLRSSEAGIAGVAVNLTGTDDQGNAVSLATTTDGSGSYQFAGLRPGSYQLAELQPAAYVDGLETQGNSVPIPGSANGSDTIGPLAVTSGQTVANNNFGEVPPSQISGQVFADFGNDGFLTGNDFGIGGVTLELTGTDINGQLVCAPPPQRPTEATSLSTSWQAPTP